MSQQELLFSCPGMFPHSVLLTYNSEKTQYKRSKKTVKRSQAVKVANVRNRKIFTSSITIQIICTTIKSTHCGSTGSRQNVYNHSYKRKNWIYSISLTFKVSLTSSLIAWVSFVMMHWDDHPMLIHHAAISVRYSLVRGQIVQPKHAS